jgi:prephenate dehydrogenase
LGTVVIVGVGLIGGSIGCGLRAAGACHEVIGVDNAPGDDAVQVGAVDRLLPLKEAAALADVLVFSTPVGAMGQLAKAASPHLKDGAVVTDTGSVKAYVAEKLAPIFGSRYVAGHPIAGKEHNGVHAADPDLYADHAAILTPSAQADDDAIRTVTAMWHWLKAHTIIMDAATHDRVFACVSHLPHLAAYALMGAVSAARTDNLDPAAFAAGGLRDFTRVASASPVMWRDICLTNQTAMVEMLDLYIDQLNGVKKAITKNDGKALLDLFTLAVGVRGRMTP